MTFVKKRSTIPERYEISSRKIRHSSRNHSRMCPWGCGWYCFQISGSNRVSLGATQFLVTVCNMINFTVNVVNRPIRNISVVLCTTLSLSRKQHCRRWRRCLIKDEPACVPVHATSQCCRRCVLSCEQAWDIASSLSRRPVTRVCRPHQTAYTVDTAIDRVECMSVKQVVKVIWQKASPPQMTVQSYSPGGASVHAYLMRASFGPPESITKTASRSVQRFLQG